MSKNTKRYLMLLLAVGLIAVAAGGSSGTFAGFTAEVANNGNTFATGTLFLHATDQGGSTCTSEAATDNMNVTNVGGTCNALFTVPVLTTASGVQEAQLTLKNAGTINAGGISFGRGLTACSDGTGTITNGTLSTSIATTDTGLALLHVNALAYGIQSGTTITLDDGTNTDTFTTVGATAAGALTITVTPHTPAFNFASGTTNVKSSPSFGAGTLCSGLEFAIVETDNAFHDTAGNQALGCAYGFGVDGTTNGCTFDATKNIGNIPSGMTPLTLNASTPGNTGNHLDANGTRYFLIRISPPAAGGLDNTFQNKTATFNLRWQIDQV
jgi:hypothetical protein